MAGIWEHVKVDAAPRLPAHVLKSAVYCALRGLFTTQQVRVKLEELIGQELSQDAATDLSAVLTNANVGTAIAKVDYLERWDAMNIAAENGLLTNEATYRSELGIS